MACVSRAQQVLTPGCCASRGRGHQQQLFTGVRDASAILGREVKPVVPTNMLQDAAKAARGEGGEKGDARDMAAMAAAMNYRKANGEGTTMHDAKGRMPSAAAADSQPQGWNGKYGAGMAKVAALGEKALAKQLASRNEERTRKLLPSHVVEPQHTKTQAQIASEEVSGNAQEADSLLPEHNLEKARKSQEQIRGEEISYNEQHASAVMPTSDKAGVHNMLRQKDRAGQEQDEEAANAKRADAIVPERTAAIKARTESEIKSAEEQYNARHAAAILPEHTEEVAHKAERASSAAEQAANARHANAVMPAGSNTRARAQRLSVAQQAAEEEKEIEGDASSLVVSDTNIDKAMNDARAQENKRESAFEQDVSEQRKALARSRKQLSSSKGAVSYSYNQLYEQALQKEESRNKAHRRSMAKSESQTQRHIDAQIAEIEGKTPKKMSADRLHEKQLEAQNEQHLVAQTDAITSSAAPRDASHMAASDMTRSAQAVKADNAHLNGQVAKIVSAFSPKSAIVAAKRAPKAASAPPKAAHKNIKVDTAKMLAGARKMEAKKDLFKIYASVGETSPRAHETWAAQSVAKNMAAVAAGMHKSVSTLGLPEHDKRQ